MQSLQQKLVSMRRAERKEVKWGATAKIGDLFIYGTVRDYSVYGVFFEPEMATDGGEFYHNDDALDQLSSDDIVTITVDHGIVFESRIKWMGKQFNHDCYGCGCEFERVYVDESL